jgi:DNA helicase HerA-like ATPase
MADETGLFIGTGGGERQILNFKRANRHGLIAGATGTGKTVTLQGIVEGFSRAGVPSFVADVKGDLSGLAMAGSPTAKVHDAFAARAAEIGDTEWTYKDNPVQFWDLFGEQGHPIRTTVSEMGPLLLSRLMDLNEVQEGVLTIAFHVADKADPPLLLLDLDDLQAMLAHCAERADELTITYGNVSKATVGTIQRSLLQLRSQGGDHFFGEPALDIHDFFKTDDSGRGLVNILAADKLMASPKLYSTFLLWLLSELFETLPEVGDPDKPKLVFFFDEAHLLFDEAPKALLDKVEQVVRLIRSKGVGVYFITQNPIDIPEDVAGQLGNRVQHALRAFTPRDQKAIKSAAETFRANPGVDVVTAITELKVGEALVSLLMADGAPSPVQRTLIKPVCSRVGPVTPIERGVIRETDAIGDKYDTLIDRESAEELLAAKAGEAQAAAAEAQAESEAEKTAAAQAKADSVAAKEAERSRLAAQREADRQARLDVQVQRKAEREAANSPWNKAITSATRSASSAVGRSVANEVTKAVLGSGRSGGSGILGGIIRGVLGGIFKGR